MDVTVDLNNYKKLSLIGKGNTSQVFKIKEKSTGKHYAAKIYIFQIDELSQRMYTNLYREVHSIIKLK